MKSGKRDMASLMSGQSGPAAIIEGDTIICANEGFCDLLGYDPSELVKKPFSKILIEQDIVHFKKSISRHKSRDKAEDDLRLLAANGSVHPHKIDIRMVSRRKKPVFLICIDTCQNPLKDVDHDSRLFLESIVDSLADPVFVKDRRHRWVLLNKACCQMIGRPRSELIGLSDYDVFPKDEADVFWEKDDIVYKTGRMIVNEEKITDSDGVTRLIMTKKSLYEDPKGLKYIVGVIRDVTEVKRYEKELEDSQRYLEDMINSISDPVFVKDRKHRWILLNDSYCSFMGYDKKELLGRSDHDFFPKKEADVFWEKDELVFSTGRNHLNEEMFTDSGGKTHTIQTHKSLFTDSHGKKYIIGTIRDMTDKKALEHDMQKSLGFLMTLVETIPLPIFYKGAKGRYIGCNTAFCDFTGIKKDALIGKKDREILSEDIAREYEMLDKCLLRSKGSRMYESKLRVPSLGFRDAVIRKAAFENISGDVSGLVGAISDVTEYRGMERRLEESHKRLEERVKKRTIQLEKANKRLKDLIGQTQIQRDLGIRLSYAISQKESINHLVRAAIRIEGCDCAAVLVSDKKNDSNMIIQRGIGRQAAKELKELTISLSNSKSAHAEYGPPSKIRVLKDFTPSISQSKYAGLITIKSETDYAAHALFLSKTLESLPGHSRMSLELLVSQAKSALGRIQSRQSIKESEQKYRTLTESSPNSIFVVGKDGRIRFCNSFGSRMLGMDQSQVLGRRVTDIFPDNIARGYMRSIRKVIRDRRPLQKESKTIYCGKKAWIWTSLVPLRDEAGRVDAAMGIAINTTERKRMEESLRYRTEFEHLISMISSDFINMPPNRIDTGVTKALGLISEITGSSYACLISLGKKTKKPVTHQSGKKTPKISSFLILPGFTNSLSSKKPVFASKFSDLTPYQRKKIKKQDFTPFIAMPIMSKGIVNSAMMLFSPLDAVKHIKSIIPLLRLATDTLAGAIERKNIEQKLRLKEYSIQMSSMPVYLVGSNGQIAYSNRASSKMLGFSEKRLKSMRIWEIDNNMSKTSFKGWWKNVKTKKALVQESIHLTKDGDIIPVEIQASYIRFGDEEYVFKSAKNISDIKRSIKTLKASETKYRALIETTATGYMILDTKGTVLDANDESARLASLKGSKDMIGKNMLEWTAKHHKKRFKKIFQTLLDKGYLRSAELEYSRNGGSDTPVEINATLIPSEGGQQILALCRDITERKLGEKLLLESESKYRSLVNNMPFGVVIHEKGFVRYAGKEALRMLGIPPGKDVRGISIWDHVHPDERRRLMKISDARYMGLDVPKHYEARLVTSSSSPLDVYITATMIYYEGRPATQVVFVDITDRKRMEKELSESEKRYRGLVESQNDMVIRTDTDSKITFLNEAFLKKFKKSRRILGRPLNLRIHPEDIKASKNADANVLKQPHRVYLEQRVRTSDGWRWIGWERTAILDGDQNIKEIQSVGRDITESKNARKELADIKGHLETILDGISESIVVIDKSYNIISYNRAFRKWIGKSNVFCAGLKCYDVIHGYKRSCRKCVVRQMFSNGKMSESVHYHQLKSGRVYHEVRAYPIEKEGEISQAIYIFRDVTERERMKDKLRENYEQILKANEELKKLDLMKSEFMAIASHELRTPIAIIKGYSDILKDGHLGGLNNRQKDKLSRISANARHLNNLVSNIMDLTRMDSGELSLSKSRFSLSKLIREVVGDMSQISKRKGVILNEDILASPMMMGDRGRMSQVLYNLIGNAIKFTPQRGSIKVRLEKKKGSIIVSVSDTGVGIPKKEIKNIFKRFYQVDPSYQRKFKGVGLGLAICQRIVILHGGRISVKSKLRKGTTVEMSFPSK